MRLPHVHRFGAISTVRVDVLEQERVLAAVEFETADSAARARDAMHQRWFDGRVVTAELSDQLPPR